MTTRKRLVSTRRCVLCGSSDNLRHIEGYAGVKGANAWVCSNSFACAQRQMAKATS